MKMIDAIQNGSGKKPQANQRVDYGIDAAGLPPTNLQDRGAGMGQPQHPGGAFLGGK